jgi:hypothetical protein
MGNVDKHRRTYSNGVKAVETEKWGARKAEERYGSLKQVDMRPKDACYPEFKIDQRLNKHYDAPNNWVRGANETAENKPGYVPGYKGKRGR